MFAVLLSRAGKVADSTRFDVNDPLRLLQEHTHALQLLNAKTYFAISAAYDAMLTQFTRLISVALLTSGTCDLPM